MLTIEIVSRLRSCLIELERRKGLPVLDIGWLRLRCDDTLKFTGEYQRASLRQLEKDLAQFVEEFPDVIPSSIVGE